MLSGAVVWVGMFSCAVGGGSGASTLRSCGSYLLGDQAKSRRIEIIYFSCFDFKPGRVSRLNPWRTIVGVRY